MGLFDGRSYSYTEGASRSARAYSPARSARSSGSKSGSRGYYVRPSASARGGGSSGSFFGGGGGWGHNNNNSSSRSSASFFGTGNNRASSSFFGGGGSSRGLFGGGGSGSSYYKRSPRQGYIAYLLHKLQRMLRELWHYARRHPLKAFVAVIVPLLSMGGAIGGLLRSFGVRMPVDLGGGGGSRGGGYYGSRGYESRGGGGGGLMENLGPIMQIAKAFT